MDKIILKNLAFFGFHGVLEQEKSLGQKFFIDITVSTDTKMAGLSDNVNHTVSYADIYETAKLHAQEKRYDLIEALAENISKDILMQFKDVSEIETEIRKPEAPVRGIFDYMAVRICRKKTDYSDYKDI